MEITMKSIIIALTSILMVYAIIGIYNEIMKWRLRRLEAKAKKLQACATIMAKAASKSAKTMKGLVCALSGHIPINKIVEDENTICERSCKRCGCGLGIPTWKNTPPMPPKKPNDIQSIQLNRLRVHLLVNGHTRHIATDKILLGNIMDFIDENYTSNEDTSATQRT